VPNTETERLAALKALEILDTPPEPIFDRITALAADLLDTPIALVSLLDGERQWFKSRHGLDLCAIARSDAFCDHAISFGPGSVMVVEDASKDPRFADNPLVAGPPFIRFYAGAVLSTPEGHCIGSLCVISPEPRSRPSDRDLARLRTLGDLVIDKLERRRVRRQAESREAFLDLAETMSGLGRWRYRLADGEISWSPEVYRIHGVSPETFNPALDSAVGFYHPEDQAKVEAYLDHAARTGEGYSFKFRLMTDAGQRDVVCRAECELGDDGRPLAIFGVFQDITDQVATLRRAQRGEARYRMLADNMGDVIARMGLDGSSSYISPAIRRLLGYTPQEMRGRSAQAFVHPEDRPLVLDVYVRLAGGLDHCILEHRAVRKDGSVIWVETHFTLIRDEAGNAVETVAVIRDVGRRKALEQALEQARLDAEAAVLAKSEFLSNMSHEIRTPLTAVLGFSGLLAADPDLPPRVKNYVSKIESGGRALLASVNDILDFSKLEAGQVDIRPEACDPAQVVGEALDLFGAAAEAKQLKLEFSIRGSRPPALWLDGGRLRQVLLNLIGNAVKFTSEGRVRVVLHHDPATARLQVAVMDTGEGVSVEDQARLFRKFSQIDASSTRRHGGTGLGLAICKGIVEAMGGVIGVASQPGQGATFWFDLPAPVALEPAAPAAALTVQIADGLAGARILVVDDHRANRALAAALLGAVGADCSMAESGQAAVDLCMTQPFDAILMDLRMPLMDGLTAARAIRSSDGPNDATPILAFSAEARTAGARDPIFAGAIDKPLTANRMVSALLAAMAPPHFAPAAQTVEQR
jgi:PAS domain S-box-containing protein